MKKSLLIEEAEIVETDGYSIQNKQLGVTIAHCDTKNEAEQLLQTFQAAIDLYFTKKH